MLDLSPVIPELVLAIGAMVLLMVGVYAGKSAKMLVWRGAYGVMILALIAILGVDVPSSSFNGRFLVDAFAVFMKIAVLVGTLTALSMGRNYLTRRGLDHMEFPVLVLLAMLGMFMMVSANDLLALYVGLELQSLSVYVLAAFNRDRLRSTEAGLKYFVLGALSSGMLLYGVSLIYGFSGTTLFTGVALTAGQAVESGNIGLLVGMVFLVAGLAFKLSAVPFHMWTPDAYEGAPTPVTTLFAGAPKIAAMALMVRVLMGPFGGMVAQWQQLVILLAIASMVLGAFAALRQTNIKRLMAYSSIAHMGYALCGLAAGTEQGVAAVAIYMAIYLTMTAGTFAIILSMRRKEGYSEDIADLAGLAQTHPSMALAMLILMFSLTGIPPLFGFFGKYYVFIATVEAGLWWLAVIGLVSSVVAAFYYINIVRLMYFSEPAAAFERGEDRAVGSVILSSTLINSPLCLLLLAPLGQAAQAAAAGFGF